MERSSSLRKAFYCCSLPSCELSWPICTEKSELDFFYFSRYLPSLLSICYFFSISCCLSLRDCSSSSANSSFLRYSSATLMVLEERDLTFIFCLYWYSFWDSKPWLLIISILLYMLAPFSFKSNSLYKVTIQDHFSSASPVEKTKSVDLVCTYRQLG